MTEAPLADADGALSSNLPPSWALTTLGTVTDYGKTSKVEPAEISGEAWVLELEDIEKDSSRILQRLTQSERLSLSTKNRFEAGDVLYGKLRPYLNKVVIADAPGFCTTEIVPVQAGSALDRRYLFHWLKHPAFLKYVEAKSHGMNMPRLGTDAGRAAPLVLAPRLEQTRIADQLDTLLARIQACQDRMATIPALLKRFRQSVLSAAASCELVDKGASAPPLVELRRALAEPLRNGKSVRDGDGLPVLRLTCLKQTGIDLNETKTGDWSGVHDARRFLIQDGDYLVSRGNGSKELVGRGGLVAGCARDIAFPDTMIRIRPDKEQLLPDYLKYVWASSVVRRQIEQSAKTTAGIWKVSQPDLERVALPIPSIEAQAEIVRLVDGLLRLASRIEDRYAAAVKQTKRLEPLTLSKAFRGELVPQDPDEEPASALLARINAQRNDPTGAASARTPRRGRPPRAPKGAATLTKSRQDDDVMGQPYLAGHLRRIGTPASAEALFKVAELPVADFYKQLAWEVAQGHVKDNQTTLEPGHAAG